MCIQQRIDLATVLRGVVPQPQQGPNLAKRHVQRAAVPNELQLLDVSLTVQPVISAATSRLRQQPLLLVVADGHDLAACEPGQFTNPDFHVIPSYA